MFVPAASALGVEGNISRAMHCTVFQNSPGGPNTWKTRLARAAFSAQHLIPSSATGSPGPSPKHPVSGLLTTWSFYPITQKTNPVCKNYTSAQGDPSGEGVESGEDSSDRTKQSRSFPAAAAPLEGTRQGKGLMDLELRKHIAKYKLLLYLTYLTKHVQ